MKLKQQPLWNKNWKQINILLLILLLSVLHSEAQWLAYYEFRNDLKDESGNDLTGSASGSGVSYLAGRFGNQNRAVSIDGNAVLLPNNNFDAQPYSVLIWYRLQSNVDGSHAAKMPIFSHGKEANYTELSYPIGSKGTLTYDDQFTADPTESLITNGEIPNTANTWYQVVLTKDSNGIKRIYVNGEIDQIINENDFFYNPNGMNEIFLGQSNVYSANTVFTAIDIDEIGFYNKDIDAIQISTDYKTDGRDITAFSFSSGQVGNTDIDKDNQVINIKVHSAIDRKELETLFTVSDDATVKVDDITIGGIGEILDFSSGSVDFNVTSEYGAVTTWTVNVTVASTRTEITEFSIPHQVADAVIDITNGTINIGVESGTDLSNLIATFDLSDGATAAISSSTGFIDQVSGVNVNDFSNNVIYRITAEDETTTRDWTVSVSETTASSNTDFTAFGFNEQTSAAKINTTNHTIEIEVEAETDLSDLIASFTLSNGATAEVGTVEQISGSTSNDFTNNIVYTITAEDGSTTQNWTISVSEEVTLSNETEIISFSFDEQTGAAIINDEDFTISIEVESGTDITELVASFTVSSGATAKISNSNQTSGITKNDFTNDVIYTITAQDESTTETWTVTVTIVGETDTNAPNVIYTDLPDIFNLEGTISFLGRVTDESTIASAVLHWKKISANEAFSTSNLTLGNNGIFTVTLDEENFDEIGYIFKVIATDMHGNSNDPDFTIIYTDYNELEIENIKELNQGTSSVDYSIIAFPFDSQPVTKTLANLGDQSAASWRLLSYDTDTGYEEFPTDFSATLPGKGYWFLSNISNEIDVSGGRAVEITSSYFELEVEAGWNMVGNPFMYGIDWSLVSTDIIATTYANGSYSTTRQQINQYEGFFINVDSDGVLQIPVSAKTTNSRIKNRTTLVNGSIDSDTWVLPLQLYNDKLKYEVSGIGMHPDASNAQDAKDWGNLPRLSEYLDISFDGVRTRDVVASDDFYSWTFTTNSSQNGAHMLRWDNSQLKNRGHNLILLDVSNSKIIDMSETAYYQFDQGEQKEFRLYYGQSDKVFEQIELKQSYVGQVYPNPNFGAFTLPISIQDHQNKTIVLNVTDMTGKKLSNTQLQINSTYQELKLESQELGIQKSGIYFLEVMVDSENHREYFKTKIIVVK